VMLYRDGRDVVSSFLKKDRAERLPSQPPQTARETAARWVESVDAIRRHAERLFVVRYEDFVSDPDPVLKSLAAYLGVDPAGFRSGRVHERSVGKHRTGLTPEELRDVMEVGGGTLRQLGYL
jgi:hypothetical protein